MSKELKPVQVPDKPIPETSLNMFEWLQAKIFHIKREGEFKMFDTIKKFLLEKLIQWIMKFAGAWFVALGVKESSVEEIIGGAVAFLVSAIWSLFRTGKIALTDPKDFIKFK
jgi:hypothetical protein